ncbi:MAG TPA: trans-aconitate 2-methyltransferase [Stellaceae bacterium]|nr:trans-aconitate 2-methyltransferase [Stellaceae bacterium]
MPHEWDAGQYLRFADERTRPAADLVGRIDLDAPRHIVDLGCGPGNSTAVLRRRWPDAAITGIDNSADMLAKARRGDSTVDFVAGDIAAWRPEAPCDLVFSNAALQWVGDHERLVPRLLDGVAPDGQLAVQMPRNHDFVTHALMRQVAAEGPWRDLLAGARDPSPVKPPEFYYDLLAPRCDRVVVWETNYIQAMPDIAAIISWLRGSGLGPFLTRLSTDEQKVFLDRYTALLAEAFPKRSDGQVLLPYPRLFFIASPRR